jgi:hypothetical protein
MAKRLGALQLLLLLGCGTGSGPVETYKPHEYQGQVDTSLSPELQATQKVVKRVLDELQRGTGYESLPELHPDVRLSESREAFFDGAIGLARWNFDGPPSGNDVPVVLYLREDSPTNPERQVRRTYTVTGSAGQYTIARKPS